MKELPIEVADPPPARPKVGRILLALVILLLSVALFSPTLSFDFLEWDDPLYVTHNAQVTQGLSVDGLRWAFSTDHAGNWHPLTWLSHMTDVSLFGMSPAGHHATNVLIHGLNGCLLFLLLASCTRRTSLALLVGLLFAFHPLRVESVAWVSERKDVLSAMFWLLTMLAYSRWAREGGTLRYLWTMLWLALGLMAKPMLVTLPLLLLLWDGWPLGRLSAANFSRRLLEKIPLLALAAASSWITLLVQRSAMEASESVPLLARVTNALVSYVRYIGKLLWPLDLSPFYPHPDLAGGTPWSLLQIGGALLLLLLISMLLARRAAPGAARVGWLWFLGSLVPVIGVIQVGSQSMADRYSYIPTVGLLIAVVWGVAALLERGSSPSLKRLASIGAVVAVLACASVSWLQLTHWRDSKAMLERALEVGPPTPLMLGNLGSLLATRGDVELAESRYREAVAIDGSYHPAHTGLADLLRDSGRIAEAIKHYREALNIAPDSAAARSNFGLLLLGGELYEEAIEQFESAIALAPGLPGLEANLARGEHALGVAYYLGDSRPRDLTQAARWVQSAAERGFARAQFDLAILYEKGEGFARSDGDALAWYRRAAEQGEADAQCNLGVLYVQGRGSVADEAEAARWFRRSAEQGYPPCEFNLGRMHFQGRGVEASDVEALAWFTLAVEHGNSGAAEWRDRCAARMTPAQLSEAQQLFVTLSRRQQRG